MSDGCSSGAVVSPVHGRESAGIDRVMGSSFYLQEHADRSVTEARVHASITMRHRGASVRAASSSTPAARCDRAETRAGSGPCLLAMASGRLVVVLDLAADGQWPAWQEEALVQGFTSCLAVPAQVSPGVTIALNLYASGTVTWDRSAVAAAEHRAADIADAVRLRMELSAAVGDGPGEPSEDEVVDQALGVTMVLNDCDAHQAFRLVTEAAHHEGVPVRQIAVDIVTALAGPATR